jgi:hypothetical protein
MFLQIVKFWHPQFFFTFDLTTHLALNHRQFLITPNYNLCPQHFVIHTSWKTKFNFQFFFLCLFFGFFGIGFGEKILTLRKSLAISTNDVGEKGLDTWDFSNDGVMFASIELWA